MSLVEDRLAALGIVVPDVVPPVAAYVPAMRAGSLVFTSGQLPFRAGELMATGTLGAAVDPTVATDCARQCALNALGAIKALIGDLDQVEQVVKLVVFVASTPDFTGQPAIANGASQLMQVAFGDAGVHARSAVGLASLPLGAPVEVEVIVSLVS
jgi:enamine deaminase RidA (YjgF/YER057c/UK114 family)